MSIIPRRLRFFDVAKRVYTGDAYTFRKPVIRFSKNPPTLFLYKQNGSSQIRTSSMVGSTWSGIQGDNGDFHAVVYECKFSQ